MSEGKELTPLEARIKTPPPLPAAYSRSRNAIVAFKFAKVGEDGVIGRIVLELFNQNTPLSAENIRALCSGAGTGNTGRALQYEGTTVGDVHHGASLRFGDVTYGDAEGDTVYGEYYEETPVEHYRHSAPGLVTVPCCALRQVAKGATQGRMFYFSSQLVLTLNEAPEMDASSLVVGRIIEGLDTAQAIAAMPCGTAGHLLTPVSVVEARELSMLGRPSADQTAKEKELRKADAERRAGLAAERAEVEKDRAALAALRKRKRASASIVSFTGAALDSDGSSSESSSEEEKKKRARQKTRRKFF